MHCRYSAHSPSAFRVPLLTSFCSSFPHELLPSSAFLSCVFHYSQCPLFAHINSPPFLSLHFQLSWSAQTEQVDPRFWI